MTVRYNDTPTATHEVEGYRAGVDRVRQYIESTQIYPKLLAELDWAIREGII